MAHSLTDPLVLAAVIASTIGVVLLLHARIQTRLLRGRIARGDGMIVVDPSTGLFSAATTWQCIRAEASRAARLHRPLHVWIATAPTAQTIDEQGHELAFDLPAGATGVRADARHLCVVSCAGEDAEPTAMLDDVVWTQRAFQPGDDAALDAYAFLSEVLHA